MGEVSLSPNRYAMAAWNNDTSSPAALDFQGNKQVLDDYQFMLIDTTDNKGETVSWKKLMRNNLLKFATGSYAPTVGITQSMYDECMSNTLYILNNTGDYIQVYSAGIYNAVAEWNIDKNLIKSGSAPRSLYYLKDGVYTLVDHKLRPWETVETKYTIGIGMDHDVYVLDNITGESGNAWQGLSLDPGIFDGIDLKQWKLAPTFISPGPFCTIGGKARNFFYLYKGETNCANGAGAAANCKVFVNNRTYPRSGDVNQITTMNYCRANNSDSTKSYPFAEGSWFAQTTYITALEALYETRYLHNNAKFGSGISSNDGCSNESTWLSNGGVRYKTSDSSSWTYATWGTTPNIYYNSTGKRTNLSDTINNYRAKEQCMESQMAFSYAMELGVEEGQEFDFYGDKFWYKIVPDTSGVEKMNVKVFKRMPVYTFNAYNASGEVTSFDIEIVLRMSLFGGVNLSGDIFAYCGGGYEQVGTCVNTTSGSINNPVDLYIETDQKKWVRESVVSKPNLGRFDFEDTYRYLESSINRSNGYALRRAPFTMWKRDNGGSLGTYQCWYSWSYNYWSSTLDTRARIAARLRGYASAGPCSPRSSTADSSVSHTSWLYGGLASGLLQV